MLPIVILTSIKGKGNGKVIVWLRGATFTVHMSTFDLQGLIIP